MPPASHVAKDGPFLRGVSLGAGRGCAFTFNATIDQENGQVEGDIEPVGMDIFEGNADAEGCAFWKTGFCFDQRCDLELPPGAPFKVTCGAVLLAQWDDDFEFVNGTWSEVAGLRAGSILVEPAASFALPLTEGPIVTDPGFSAFVMRLDTDALAPGRIEFQINVIGTGAPDLCFKVLDIALLETVGGPRFIVPTEGLGLDFTQFAEPDQHVQCLEVVVPVERTTWGRLKARRR